MFDREVLGKIVRETWIKWAKKQPANKPSWLVEWNKLDEPDKEVDRLIGEAVVQHVFQQLDNVWLATCTEVIRLADVPDGRVVKTSSYLVHAKTSKRALEVAQMLCQEAYDYRVGPLAQSLPYMLQELKTEGTVACIGPNRKNAIRLEKRENWK